MLSRPRFRLHFHVEVVPGEGAFVLSDSRQALLRGRLAELIRGGGNGSLARWCYYLECLNRRGMLCHSAHANGRCLATLVAGFHLLCGEASAGGPGRRSVLSRFASLRRERGEAVLESTVAHARLVLDDCRTAALVAVLMAPITVEELAERFGEVPSDAVSDVFILLQRARMLAQVGAEEICAENDDSAL